MLHFLTIIQYFLFFSLLSISTYYMYNLVTSKNERNFHRIKLRNMMQEQSQNVVGQQLDSQLQTRLNQLGIRVFNAFHFQFIRLMFLFFISFYYIFMPFISKGSFHGLAVFSLLVFVILTEPRLKYSMINLVINSLIKRNEKAKMVELFTLFDILKAELNTLKPEQEVNVYNIIKHVLPMFKHIKGTLIKFLSLWKRSPRYAKEVFYQEIGGDNAKALSDVLYKLDNVSKNEGLHLINSEASVFSVQYYQEELKKSGKSSVAFHGFFLFSNLMIIVWLIVFLFNMFNDRLGGTGF